MKIGIWPLYTDRWPTRFADLAAAVEDRGFESLWVGEHTHIPVRSAKFPAKTALEVAARFPDPFVLLSAAAAVTSRLRLGTAVSLAAEHEPLGLAHAVASLDFISHGRFELGIGYGSNVPEMRNRGLDVRKRRAILREKVLAMIEIWTHDVAAFEGEHVRFTESWSWPKPVQKPHPPILLGCRTPACLAHVVEFCSGWLPNSLGMSDDDLGRSIARLRRAAEAAGRGAGTVSVTAAVSARTLSERRATDFFAEVETLDEFVGSCFTRQDRDRYASLGVDRVILSLTRPKAKLLAPMLDHLAAQTLA
jgi:probable F420-dependent oxidoreductase